MNNARITIGMITCVTLLLCMHIDVAHAVGYLKIGDLKGESIDAASEAETQYMRFTDQPDDEGDLGTETDARMDADTAETEVPHEEPKIIFSPIPFDEEDESEDDGGMPQIDPPTLELDGGPDDLDIDTSATESGTTDDESDTASPSEMLDAEIEVLEDEGADRESEAGMEAAEIDAYEGSTGIAEPAAESLTGSEATGNIAGAPAPSAEDTPGSAEVTFPPPEAPVITELLKDGAEGKNMELDPTGIVTREALDTFTEAIEQSDTSVQKVRAKEDTLVMKYRHPAKLFGFIPMNYTLETEVSVRGWDPVNKEAIEGEAAEQPTSDDPDDFGRIKVKLPWYLFLASDDADEVIEQMEADMEAVRNQRQLDTTPLETAEQKQQQTMQMMSNISKMLHDTQMAVIRKIGG